MKNKSNDFMNRREKKPQRKGLRNHGTPAEAALWSMIKRSQVEDLKFRRQHSIGPYIVDFYCPEIGLIIELDGQVHVNSRSMEDDEKRTIYIQSLGLQVMRFENRFVFCYPDSIIDAITEYKKEKESGHLRESNHLRSRK
ncbi:MAG: endonuclease domain-containing protein [Tannerellaceae bacterium]|nr:endonuclease domain-containing protein [Tannerellaceae bacterium]